MVIFENYCLTYLFKYVFWVPKWTVSLRWFFWVPTTYVLVDELNKFEYELFLMFVFCSVFRHVWLWTFFDVCFIGWLSKWPLKWHIYQLGAARAHFNLVRTFIHFQKDFLFSYTIFFHHYLNQFLQSFSLEYIIRGPCCRLVWQLQGVQWLSGRVLDLRRKGSGFEPH